MDNPPSTTIESYIIFWEEIYGIRKRQRRQLPPQGLFNSLWINDSLIGIAKRINFINQDPIPQLQECNFSVGLDPTPSVAACYVQNLCSATRQFQTSSMVSIKVKTSDDSRFMGRSPWPWSLRCFINFGCTHPFASDHPSINYTTSFHLYTSFYIHKTS